GFCGQRGAAEEELQAGEGGEEEASDKQADCHPGCVELDTGDHFMWLDPREQNISLLWAYGKGEWPGYHNRAGSFSLPWLQRKVPPPSSSPSSPSSSGVRAVLSEGGG
ncbi:unnamed protein product, partial [Discosporangium mesarthrocarpum]